MFSRVCVYVCFCRYILWYALELIWLVAIQLESVPINDIGKFNRKRLGT